MSEASQRRNSPRRRFSCRARFRDPRALAGDSGRLCVTRDFSRDGIYFIADDNGLRENMQLLMRFPESIPAAQDREYLLEIRRMNSLPEDRCGVGARLILRAMVGQLEHLVAPKVDLSTYGCLYVVSPAVDLYA
jgi:PilZ domain